MADTEFSLLSYLKTNYPAVPITTVRKVMDKFDNDQDKCRQALALEAEKWTVLSDGNNDTSSTSSVSDNPSNSNNLGSPAEGKSIATRIKELKVSHEISSIPPKPSERHVSTIERSIGNSPRVSESKPQLGGQSVSWTVQTTERPSTAGSQGHINWPPVSNVNTPQTAPPDFTPFFNRSATNIPNIDCRTYSGTSSPGEQRRPVKVINIPPGSVSGGSVSPAATPPNSRHIRMHFGDTGGICTVSTPLSSIQRYGSTPNVSQNYRSEFHTEASAPPSVHSSSIVVNTTSHTNHLAGERKPISTSNSDSSGNGRRTPNLNISTVTGDNQSSNAFSSGKPLSTPVQASSPGISHTKPVFLDKREQLHGYNDTSYQSGFYPVGHVRPPPNSGFYPAHVAYPPGNSLSYTQPYNSDFPSTSSGFTLNQPQQEQYPQQKHPGYNSPPTNFYHSTTASGYPPNSYSQFNTPTSMGFQGIGITGQNPSHQSHYTHYSPHGSHSPGIHISRSSNVPQPALSSRSNSQDSEHSLGGDFDPRHNFFNNMGSRVSSHSSLSSDSSSSRIERVEQVARPRSGSIQDDADYIRALLQHQKMRMQKLHEDMNQHKAILNTQRSEVSMMEKNMIEHGRANKSFPSVEDISGLCERNRLLQTDIQMYMNEIEMYKSGQTPYNKINPMDQQNFFENMPTGQQDPIYSWTPDGKRTPSPRPTPPPRPPPPIPERQRSTGPGPSIGVGMSSTDINRVPPVPSNQPIINSGDSEEGESWSCSACTFSNHPALKKCEMCEMPRVLPSHTASVLGPPALPPHQPLASMQPRLTSHPPLGHHHHHRAGT